MATLRDRYGLRGVALSGYGMEEDVARAIQAGFAAHLVKPVDFQQLCFALGRLWETQG
jgi:CheY-like chemotaxis protein